MTLILQDVGSKDQCLDDSSYVINANSKQLLMHVKHSKLKKFEIPLVNIYFFFKI